jgi:hypothetical protein
VLAGRIPVGERRDLPVQTRQPDEVWNVARAIWEYLAFDAHHDPCAMVPGKRFRAVVDRCFASDSRAKRFAVETYEQQPDIRVPVNVSKRAVHIVAVVLGILKRVRPGYFDESRIA